MERKIKIVYEKEYEIPAEIQKKIEKRVATLIFNDEKLCGRIEEAIENVKNEYIQKGYTIEEINEEILVSLLLSTSVCNYWIRAGCTTEHSEDCEYITSGCIKWVSRHNTKEENIIGVEIKKEIEKIEMQERIKEQEKKIQELEAKLREYEKEDEDEDC